MNPSSFATLKIGLYKILLAFVLVSCATILPDKIHPPKLRLIDIKLENSTFLEQRFELTFHAQNPNSIALPIAGLDFSLELQGSDFSNGVSKGKFSIPAHGNQTFKVSVAINLLKSMLHISRLIMEVKKPLDYKMVGKIQIDIPMVDAISFEEQGTLPLPSTHKEPTPTPQPSTPTPKEPHLLTM